MVSLNSIILTTVAVFGVFNNHTYVLTSDDGLIIAKWDHAVNSKAEIEKALKSDSTMIEADVILGSLYNANSSVDPKVIPIMGHPPADKSDLSLKEFLNQCKNSNKTVVKLDFKSTDAFVAAIPIMEESFKDFKSTPKIWLNADILPGPGLKNQEVVHGNSFIQKSEKSFPDAMLSLGWTTKNCNSDKYTPENIMSMRKLLLDNNYHKPVTYAVKASLAANTIDQLEHLLFVSRVGSTLTIWCNNKNEVLNYDGLVNLAKLVGIGRVYWDLPDEIFNKFIKKYNASNTYVAMMLECWQSLAQWLTNNDILGN